MGFLDLFKKFSSQIKCDKKQTETNNWHMQGNKMQKLKFNKEIVVEPNQISFIRFKDKTCDILPCGSYKINQETLPITSNRFNIKKYENIKRVKIKADVYYLKEKDISYNLEFNNKQKINKISIKENIIAQIMYDVIDVKTLCKFLFLENAIITSDDYNALMQKELYNNIEYYLQNFKGEWADLEDSDIALSIKQKVANNFYSYGIEIKNIIFTNYKSISNKGKQQTKNKQQIQEISSVDLEDQNIDFEQDMHAQSQQYLYSNQYSEAIKTRKITINPED